MSECSAQAQLFVGDAALIVPTVYVTVAVHINE